MSVVGADPNQRQPLDPKIEIRTYIQREDDPTFEWGNASGGAKQLSFAILMDALDNDLFRATRCMLHFMHSHIRTYQPGMGFTLPLTDVEARIKQIEDVYQKDLPHIRRMVDSTPGPQPVSDGNDKRQGVQWDQGGDV